MMKLSNPEAEVYIPDGSEPEPGLARTTHLAIGAHQDDLEIMAIDGILKCFQRDDRWFTGVTVTDGQGSPRTGIYADFSNQEMMRVRAMEQKKAAQIGDYAAQLLLGYPSSAIKTGLHEKVLDDIQEIVRAARPSVLYTHNLADKHQTHIGVVVHVIHALRAMDPEELPQQVYGVEIWRALDWMMDDEKVLLDCSPRKNLQEALLGVFDSQISGGKRYDKATMGRRLANATYLASHETDQSTGLTYAMDLTPLINHPEMSLADYVRAYIARFADDVSAMISRVSNA